MVFLLHHLLFQAVSLHFPVHLLPRLLLPVLQFHFLLRSVLFRVLLQKFSRFLLYSLLLLMLLLFQVKIPVCSYLPDFPVRLVLQPDLPLPHLIMQSGYLLLPVLHFHLHKLLLQILIHVQSFQNFLLCNPLLLFCLPLQLLPVMHLCLLPVFQQDSALLLQVQFLLHRLLPVLHFHFLLLFQLFLMQF